MLLEEEKRALMYIFKKNLNESHLCCSSSFSGFVWTLSLLGGRGSDRTSTQVRGADLDEDPVDLCFTSLSVNTKHKIAIGTRVIFIIQNVIISTRSWMLKFLADLCDKYGEGHSVSSHCSWVPEGHCSSLTFLDV